MLETVWLGQASDFDVTWAASAAACAEKLAAGVPFDALLCDVACIRPGANDVLALVGRERPGLPVILVTPESAEHEALAALDRGAADYAICSPDGKLPLQRLGLVVERALERAQLRRAAARRVRLLKILRAITSQVTAGSDLAPILSSVVETAHRYLQFEQIAVYLVEPETGILTLGAVAGADPARIPPVVYHLAQGEGTPGRAVAERTTVRVDDFAATPDDAPALGLPNAAELSVPIREANRIIGVLTIASSQPGSIDPVEEEELTLLAEHLAIAIRSEAFIRREAVHAAREALLTTISHAVNSSLGLSQVLQHAVAEVGQCLHVDRCALGQIDLKARQLLVEHEHINPMLTERRRLRGRRQPLVGSLKRAARLLQAGEVIVSTENDVHPMLKSVWRELSQRYETRSLAVIPIPSQSPDHFYCLGLVQVTHARRWSDDDLALLRAIAGQLALALRNAQLFEAMRQAAAELGSKNAELESFVYTVSHDLQAPVVSLRGFASLLQSRYGAQFDERGRMYVSRMAANAEFLGRMLHDLLELSRVGRLEEPTEAVPVESVLEPVIADLTQALAVRGVRLELPERWPSVRYSRTHLRQIFANLLSNAIKFLGPQPEPCIEIGWRALSTSASGPRESAETHPEQNSDEFWGRKHEIEFFVRDNGIGIHPDYHQRIFGPFQRLNVIEVEGTGVGLSIVKRVVERHGGTLRVESALGAGATFYFTVPEAAPANHRSPSETPEAASPEAARPATAGVQPALEAGR
ncbi:MAG: GAF domain-containing protein [Anaerolineales bacterium]